ncbi:MAG: Fis family transcriptional regulator [Deltaproteobacteria bacterium CG_4_10_14_3_um_filter_51_14]|nr:MAG: Fis family transcriptional regulator [Deltaproteobacteria bacterium CG_4_10_14_3_um_filter_51_14]
MSREKQNLNQSGKKARDEDQGYCKLSALPSSHCCTILESIGEGVFTIDLKKTITYFNSAAEAITGFSSAEAVGQQCFDVFRADICEKGCPLDTNPSSQNSNSRPRVTIISKSGQETPVSMSTSLLRDSRGKVVGGVRVFKDLSDIERLRRELSHRHTLDDIIGKSTVMKEIISFLPDISESDSAVLIEGPTGSGKELIAKAIQQLSRRKSGPFIALNCAALPETLLESELFGYSKGAFTGAVRNKAGRIQLANRGTLFLDEISSTSLAFQADLLRVLEDGEFTPLGETKTMTADFRLITATNMDLSELVSDGKFREDLYYRLNVAKITLPPLSKRKEDIPALIEHFIQKFNLIKGKSITAVTPELLSLLLDYSFPGNIRELENIIEYCFITCKNSTIGMEHIARDLLSTFDKTSIRFSDAEAEEADKIKALLERCYNNRIEVAKAIGLSRTSLWRKMKKYGLM